MFLRRLQWRMAQSQRTFYHRLHSETPGCLPYLQILARSRSTFDSIAGQIGQIDVEHVPKFATLTIGGNNAEFFEVVSDCVYQKDKEDYGPAYPNMTGACARPIDKAKDTILKSDYAEVLVST